MKIMDNIKKIIEQELKSVDKELGKAVKKNNDIYNAIHDFIESPLKRIRSISAILYLKLNQIVINQKILDILTAGELIHNASLLHDDVIDNSDTRRGVETLWSRYTPQISILSGNILVSTAVDKLITLNDWNILGYFQNCTKRMNEAEIEQYLMRGKILSADNYIKIAEGKTASLFEAIFASCAVSAGLDKQKAVYFAKNFGILFQLKNDLSPKSMETDKQNRIFTLKDILGIEKTYILMDNYQEEIRRVLEEFPESIYKQGLKDLLINL